MLEVNHLTRRFGSIMAVDRISFAVGSGEIVGLLGPNGAGKSTTMRMLTTYLPPSSGRAIMAGYDVLDQAIGVRRNVGYLPENVPLYPEMRVIEYLKFRAQLKDVPRSRRRKAVAEVLARCGLGDVENRILGHLSRGYRQRVGLAEAMIHDPPILILDEPTAGLDPIQIREVRSLIRELGDSHTILLSTHIMSEVEAICGRVIVIARGRIAVDERLDRLQGDQIIVIEARGPVELIRDVLCRFPGVERVVVVSKDDVYATLEVVARDGADLREPLGQRLASNGWPLRQLEMRRSSLEDRFIRAVTRETLAGPEIVAEPAA